MKILVTGGAGFIGSAFVRMMIAQSDCRLVNLDKLTYAGNLENLAEVEDDERYRFVQGDICNQPLVDQLVAEEQPDAIVHFAAESHVDRSILSPEPVIRTNVQGTFTLLEAARRFRVGRFLHVSTDEVYGSLDAPQEATEEHPLRASSPYSASKASADLLVRSYFVTYRLPIVITRASNNYGPYQFPEKLIPLMITNALDNRRLPVYGDGQQVRDWLYVDDHCQGIWAALQGGREGEIYNIGGDYSLTNIEVVRKLLELTNRPEALIEYVPDRPGHDRRYAVSSDKLMRETGWSPGTSFEAGLSRTIDWYKSHTAWIEHVRSGEYLAYYEQNYGRRLASH